MSAQSVFALQFWLNTDYVTMKLNLWHVRFLLVSWLLKTAWCMYSKRDLPDDLSEVASSKRFRNNLADLFLNNDVSAKRVLSVYQDAELASAENMKDLSSLKVDKNIHRNLLKKLLKKNRKQWPGIYYGKIRVFDIQKQQEVRKDIPFFLIHELLAKLAATSNLSKLCDPLALTELQAAHLQSCKIELKLNPDSILIPLDCGETGLPAIGIAVSPWMSLL